MTPTKTEPLEAQMQSTTSVDLRAMAGAPKGTSGVRTVPLGMLHRTADEIDDLAAALRQIVSEMAPARQPPRAALPTRREAAVQ